MRADARIRLWRVIWAVAFAVVLVAGGAAENVEAAQVTFNFEGDVTWVGADIAGTFSTSQTLSGSFTFDSATPAFYPFPNLAQYNGALTALTFTVGTYTGTLGVGLNFIRVKNDFDNGLGLLIDEYGLVNNPFSGLDVDGLAPANFTIDLIDPTHTAFSSDALPTTPPDLSLFADETFIVRFDRGSLTEGPRNLSGTITSLTPVPETHHHAPSRLWVAWTGRVWEKKVL